MSCYEAGFNEVMAAAGLGMEKTATVHPLVKQYRRAMQMFHGSDTWEGVPGTHSFHGTPGLKSIAEDGGTLRANSGTHGRAVYFSQDPHMDFFERAMKDADGNILPPPAKGEGALRSHSGVAVPRENLLALPDVIDGVNPRAGWEGVPKQFTMTQDMKIPGGSYVITGKHATPEIREGAQRLQREHKARPMNYSLLRLVESDKLHHRVAPDKVGPRDAKTLSRFAGEHYWRRAINRPHLQGLPDE